MSDIPAEAIEAAAKGLWDHRELNMVFEGYECYCRERVSEGYAIAPSKVAHGKHQARAAIEAAMPAIRESIAQEIEAADLYPDSLPRLTYDEAARIVRGRRNQ